MRLQHRLLTWIFLISISQTRWHHPSVSLIRAHSLTLCIYCLASRSVSPWLAPPCPALSVFHSANTLPGTESLKMDWLVSSGKPWSLTGRVYVKHWVEDFLRHVSCDRSAPMPAPNRVPMSSSLRCFGGRTEKQGSTRAPTSTSHTPLEDFQYRTGTKNVSDTEWKAIQPWLWSEDHWKKEC